MFVDWSGEEAKTIDLLPQSGSYREYIRMKRPTKTAIGTYNFDLKENRAFLALSRHFFKYSLNVPEVLEEGQDKRIYLLSDLGDQTLFDFLAEKRELAGVFPGSALEKYKMTLEALPRFQIEASKDLDYSVCYPRAAFDRQSMMWDLSYFKYYFLKLAKIPFDEQLLENDYVLFTEYLLTADSNYFLYRDFQSRNVMIFNDKPYFIDYQGGRRGALQYDVASLLYDSKANIPGDIKGILLDHYLKTLENHIHFDRKEFIQYYQGFVLIRMMQAMGAYGFRGFYERKTQFLKSIPYALKQLAALLPKLDLPVKLPHLQGVLRHLIESEELKKYTREFNVVTPLNVSVTSFSYKKGIPQNETGDGGGFVFDCRCLHNPGRYEQYKDLTGKDLEVADFLKQGGEADDFLHEVFQLVEQAVEKYLNREFKNLQVSFGCTGGQHRSVYCAERLAEHLKEKYPRQVNIALNHREQPNLNAL